MRPWKQSLPFRAVESLSCKAHARLLDRAFNTDLSWKERILLRFHGNFCAPCRRYTVQAKLVEDLRRELWSEDNADLGQLSDQARERIQEKLREDRKGIVSPDI